MRTYKLSPEVNWVFMLENGVFNGGCIICNPEYLAWLAEGNTPLPADPPTPQQLLSSIEQAIQTHMDEVAQSKRYDNRDSCRLYAGYLNPFQAEAIAFGQWVAACWMVSNTAQAYIIAGTRTIPTPAEAILELPTMVWPV